MYVQGHVQQQLVTWLQAAGATRLQSVQHLPRTAWQFRQNSLRVWTKPLKWLIVTAGPAAVAAPAVAHALLRITADIPDELKDDLHDTAIKHGLQLSADQLVAASRE